MFQDRDGAVPPPRASRPSWLFVQLAFCRRSYQGPRVVAASPIRIEIVRKPDGQIGFSVHARRWVVERFFAWINRNRRLAEDFEAFPRGPHAGLLAHQRMGHWRPCRDAEPAPAVAWVWQS